MTKLKLPTDINKTKKLKNTNNKTNEKKKNKTSIKIKRKYERFRYTEACLKEAIQKINSKEMSVNKASINYKIPRSTLRKKIEENITVMKKMGPSPVLTPAEEERIKKWIIHKARIGHPMHPKVVKKAIKNVLDAAPRPNCFKDNHPGNKWFKLFLKRHPEIALKKTEVLSKSRASVTEENIRDWFSSLKSYLESENASDILDDPSRIYNMDETGVQLCPKTGKLLGEVSERNHYAISAGQDKVNITVLCSYCADGRAVRPMIIYPYKRKPPDDICNSVPEGYMFGNSPKGWMTTDTFNKFIRDGFYEQLKSDLIKFPVLLLFDGHSSHTSLELHDFCKDKGILLFCLYPNATHLIQPCDVGIFKPLKTNWTTIVNDHSQLSTACINKNNFAPIFHSAFVKSCDPKVIKKSFECCGFYPFNPDRVNYSKCISQRRKLMREESITSGCDQKRISEVHPLDNIVMLQNIENNIPLDILNEFKNAYDKKQQPPSELMLFNMWKRFKNNQKDVIEDTVSNKDSAEPNFKDKQILPHNTLDLDLQFCIDETELEIHPRIIEDQQQIISLETVQDDCSDLVTELNEGLLLSSDESNIVKTLPESVIVDEYTICKDSSVNNTTQNDEETDLDKLLASDKYTINDHPQDKTMQIEASHLDQLINPANVYLWDNLSKEVAIIDLSNDEIDDIQNNNNVNLLKATVQSHAAEIRDVNDKKSNTEDTQQFLEQITIDKVVDDVDERSANSNISPSSMEMIIPGAQTPSSMSIEELWDKELHFPAIIKSNKRKIAKKEVPKVFAITSEEWKKQQEEKLKMAEEKQRIKEYNQFKREVTKKIKLEQIEKSKAEKEAKKELRLKNKAEVDRKKKEKAEILQKILEEKAKMLNLPTLQNSSGSRKKKSSSNISNDQMAIESNAE